LEDEEHRPRQQEQIHERGRSQGLEEARQGPGLMEANRELRALQPEDPCRRADRHAVEPPEKSREARHDYIRETAADGFVGPDRSARYRAQTRLERDRRAAE